MLKNKKSIAVILSLVMLLAMACGAWAATITETTVVSDVSLTTAKIVPAGDLLIVSPDGVHVVGENTERATGVQVTDASLDVYGGVEVSAGGAEGNNRGITTARAIVNITGDMVISANSTEGRRSIGVNAAADSYVTLYDNIVVSGAWNFGISAVTGSTVIIKKDVIVSGGSDNAGVRGGTGGGTVIVEGNMSITGGDNNMGIFAGTSGTEVTLKGDLNISAPGAIGAVITEGATVKLDNGNTITMDDESQTGFLLSGDSSVIFDGVTADAEGLDLFVTDSSGSITANNSDLTGNVVHDGTEEGALDITLTDSALNASVEASGDVGTINITLVGSNWNVTGDSNTNGIVTGDGNSVIDYSLSPEETTAIIETLKGNAGVNMKIGDELIIRNPDGDISSNNPEVIEVIVDEVTGEVSIISKADGEAELTYSYIDANNKIQTVTIKVVSGAGSEPESNNYGGGGSSNCNAGMGIGALVSLLGLALVMRKK